MKLTEQRCVPCEGGVDKMTQAEIDLHLKEIDGKWGQRGDKISRTFNFINFAHNMDFVNKVAKIAEQEGHHPDLHISYAICTIELWTHAIDGLSINDFVLAAKIDEL